MSKMRSPKFLLVCFLFIYCFEAIAQSDPKLSNYSFTPLTYNPAYAGSYGGLTISSFYTAQWVGFEGAPTTIIVNGHDMFSDSQVGLGVDFISDEIGASSEIKLAGNFAYHFNISKNWKISAGIKAGLLNHTINYQKLTIEDPGEFSGDIGEVTNTKPLIGAGFYLHNEDFYIGFSVPNIIAYKFIDEYKNSIANTVQNLFIITGYNIEIEDKINLQPSVMTRMVKGAPLNTLIALNANWDEKIYAGLNFEADVSLGAFVGIRFLENFMFGYAYDMSVNEFSQYNNGIHSITLSFRESEISNRKRCGCNVF